MGKKRKGGWNGKSKKRSKYNNAGVKALRIVKAIQRGTEKKTIQVVVADSTPTTTAVVQHLSACATGDDLSSRDGRRIKAFSIQLMGTLTMHETATTTSTRVIVFIDHANQGTVPALALWWDDDASFFNGEMRGQSPDANSRFIVLYDKVILQSDSGTKLNRIKFYKRIFHQITYTGTAATDEGLGTIFIMTASSEVTNTPTLVLKSTFKWVDL